MVAGGSVQDRRPTTSTAAPAESRWGEVGRAGGVDQSGVVQQSAGEEQFGVDVGALELAEGATVDVGPVAVVEQGLREDASGAFLSGSGEHAAGRGEECRRQVGVAPRVHAEGEPQSPDRVLGVGAGQRP